jgi:hypothetical protein
MMAKMSTLVSTRSRPPEPDVAHRRPLAAVALLGGIVAAGVTLAGCVVLGIVGWFLADGGLHGEPSDGMRVGALGWLLAHGSGLLVDGARVTAMPLGITVLALLSAWRVGHHVGDAVSGHGPDADRLADGERDWTVPAATACYTGGYLAVALLTLRLAAGATEPSAVRVVGWCLLLAGVAGGLAIATGSGRLAIWTRFVPPVAVAALATVRSVLAGWAVLALLFFLGALVVDVATAANILGDLHAGAGDAVAYGAASLALLPNATVFSGSYLLGPGFMVGSHTLVTPSAVVLGPLPLFPALAALPDPGTVPAWTPWLVVLPPLVAALAAARAARRFPVTRWSHGALRGLVGGVVAGVAVGALARVAGGAVGPGRMQDVAPYSGAVLVHAVALLGIGALVGSLAMTWHHRRRVPQ